jgi:hypothetical protein
MELLQAGVDRSVIALWLGHVSVETAQIYLDANLALKEETRGSAITYRYEKAPANSFTAAEAGNVLSIGYGVHNLEGIPDVRAGFHPD